MTSGGWIGQITFRRVADLERAHAFYAEALGLPLVLDQGRCRIYRVHGEAYLGLCLADAATVAADSALVCLLSTDVGACFERVRALGAVVEHPPCHNAEFAIYHAFVRDPDAHLVELQTFDDPRWATRA